MNERSNSSLNQGVEYFKNGAANLAFSFDDIEKH
jgi:hypothetical protein